MAFILPKGIIKEMIKRLRTFLWKGTSAYGYPKVAWEVVCRPIEEGGLGIKDILALNRALMSKHLWAVIKQDRTSIWLIGSSRFDSGTVRFGQLRKTKELGLEENALTLTFFDVAYSLSCWEGDSVSLWHDPWHPLGPLISRFPRGSQMTRTGLLDKLSVVVKDGQWNWPLITDIACLEITHMLPPILDGPNRISWKSKDGSFNTSIAYELFHPPGPKVLWSSLLMGSFKIPKNCFILWLAIMGECLHWINLGFTILEGPAFCARMESRRHTITFSFHAHFPAAALPLSDSRSHFHGPTRTGNMVFNGCHPDGVESMWLM
ncbi:hypothetical protein Sango_2888400 [Sesamum angolense]|uniref:Reverse transcriptase zinc-binding domain-containing protein n=1 Tax=Sesamum angolense TaxID=2727404 RepID=A0AAE1T6W1_9LAMI|nr:hypothetical protein Sango_2888400 [Sesamum angolense]